MLRALFDIERQPRDLSEVEGEVLKAQKMFAEERQSIP